MIEAEMLSKLSELFSNSTSFVVVFSSEGTLDQKAAAMALASSLAYQGKDVRLCSDRELKESELEVEDVDVFTEIGNQNLTVSFDYNAEQVDKVSYHIGEETNKFFLTIKPRKGVQPLNYENVEFSYTGAEADVIITVGVSKLDDLMQLYFGYEDFYENSNILSINTYETTFGNSHFDTSRYSSFSEAVARLINDLGWQLDDAMATNLLTAIDIQTNGLQSLTVSADTFETIARLLRTGGRRKSRRVQQSSNQPQKNKLSKNEDRRQNPGQQEIKISKKSKKKKSSKKDSSKDSSAAFAEGLAGRNRK